MSSNGNKSARRSLKRKADAATEPLERKRAQNRISQQCLREKNVAYIRNLENTVELLQNAVKDTDGPSREDRYAELLEAHLKLMKDNQALEEAVLRLRKKLLSLSNAAAAAAGDDIFDLVLKRKDDPKNQDLSEGSRVRPEMPALATERQGSHINIPGLTRKSSFSKEMGTENPGTLNGSAECHAFGDISALLDCGPHTYEGDRHYDLQTTALPPTNMLNINGASLPSLDIAASPKPSVFTPETIRITSLTVFGAKLLSACRQCIERKFYLSLANSEPSEAFNKKLIVAAANLVASSMGLESYFYGVNATHHIEKVLGWRLGLETKEQVPSPFRPTPLQSNFPNHFWGIDLFHWPDIRDQLLLEQGPVDLDTLTKDIILHSVVEQPFSGVAIGVLDMFQNHILRRDQERPSQTTFDRHCLNDPSWILFEVKPEAQSLYTPSTTDPVEEALISELERRMQDCHNGDALSLLATGGPGGNDIALFLGIDAMGKWKLSKDFGVKYPFLDCSTAVSACDLAPSSAVFRC